MHGITPLPRGGFGTPGGIQRHIDLLQSLGIELSLVEGPVISGGALTRFFSGEEDGEDLDLFFFDEASMQQAEQILTSSGWRLLRRNPTSRTAIYGTRGRLPIDLICLPPGSTLATLLAKIDILACAIACDGASIAALPGAIDDARRRCASLRRQTVPTRLQRYLQRGWSCPEMNMRNLDDALQGAPVIGLTSETMPAAERYGHTPRAIDIHAAARARRK